MDIVTYLAVWVSQDWNKVDIIHPSSLAEEPNNSVTPTPYLCCDTTMVHQQALILSVLHHQTCKQAWFGFYQWYVCGRY